MAHKFLDEGRAFIHRQPYDPGPSNADVILALREGDGRIIETLAKGRIDAVERKVDKLVGAVVLNEVFDERERIINARQAEDIKSLDDKFIGWCGRLDARLIRLEAGGHETGDRASAAAIAADFCVNHIDDEGNVIGEAGGTTLPGLFIAAEVKSVELIGKQTSGFDPDEAQKLYDLLRASQIGGLEPEVFRWIILILGKFAPSGPDTPQARQRGRKGAA